MKPIHSFWIYANEDRRKSYRVKVLVFDGKRSLREHASRYYQVAKRRGVSGMFSWRGKMKRGQLGTILFTLKDKGMGTVTHECVHAGLCFMAKLRKPQLSDWRGGPDPDEVVAYAIGEMASQVAGEFWERGYYTR